MPRYKGTIEQVQAIEREVISIKRVFKDPFESKLLHVGGSDEKLFPGEEPHSKVFTNVYEITANIRHEPTKWSGIDLIAWLLSDPVVVRFYYNEIKKEARFDVNKRAWDKLIGCAQQCSGKGILPQLKDLVRDMERDWTNGG